MKKNLKLIQLRLLTNGLVNNVTYGNGTFNKVTEMNNIGKVNKLGRPSSQRSSVPGDSP